MADQPASRRYAQAVFTKALDGGIVRSIEDDLNTIVGLLETDDGFRDFILAPFAGRDEKIAILQRIFSDRITALTMQLLRIMIEKGREDEITAVRDEFIRLRRENSGVVFATVTSSEAMGEDQKKALVAKLDTALAKKVEAEFKVDHLLIGGVRVAYGNYVIDGSLRGALSSLREILRHDLLKQQ